MVTSLNVSLSYVSVNSKRYHLLGNPGEHLTKILAWRQ